MNIGIIGLGLMGASFAKRLSPQKDKTIYGIDQNEQTIQTALELNISRKVVPIQVSLSKNVI